jgi:hypothetical protein
MKATRTCRAGQQLQQRVVAQRSASSLQLLTKTTVLLQQQLGEEYPQPMQSNLSLIDAELKPCGDVV